MARPDDTCSPIDALPAERALLGALFTQSPISVALYDAAGRVASANAAYERHFGIRVADIPPGWSLFGDPQLEAAGLLPLIRDAYAGAQVVLPPVRYDAARATGGAGRSIWTQGHCYPVHDDAGRVTHVAIMHVDVTPLVESREALAMANAELGERNLLLQEQAVETEAQTEELQSATEELMLRTEELARARDAIDAERARLGRVVAQLPAAVAVLEGPELVFRGMSAQYRTIVGGRDVTGRPIREAIAELAGSEGTDFFALMEGVYRTGEPFVGTGLPARWDADGDGVAEDHFVDVTYAPFYGPDGDAGGVDPAAGEAAGGAHAEREIQGITIMVLDVSARVRAEAAVRESEERFRSMADAAPVMLWVTEADGTCTFLNRQWYAFTGQTRADGLGFGWLQAVHPDDRPIAERAFRDATATGGGFQVDYRLRRHDGEYRWALDAAAPRRAPDGTFLGYIGSVVDIEERTRLLEAERAAHAAAERAAERARRLQELTARLNEATSLEQVADVVLAGGIDAVGADAGSLALVHPAAGDQPARFEMIRSTGYPDEVAARYRSFPVSAGRPLSDTVLGRRAVLVASPDEWRGRYPRAMEDLTELGFGAFAALPVMVDERVVAALSFSFRPAQAFDDSTRTFLATLGEQCALALARARAFAAVRRAEQASAFLAEASALLAESLEYETTLRTLAEATVPRLGDWCAVDVVRDPTVRTWPPLLDRLAVVQPDPAMRALGDELSARYPTDWSAPTGMAAVLRDGTPLFMPRVTDAMIVALARDAEHLRLLRALRLSSVIVVPLKARGLTLGALTLCMTYSGRTYDEADLALAQDLAQRAAIAVDNARLYREAARARQEAEAANLAKSQFLATMSHELRTPLNAIQGHVQLMELGIHGDVTSDQRAALDRVQRAQQHLLGLIDEVLGYARLESGRVEYDIRPVAIGDVVGDVRPMVEPQLAAKGLELVIDLPEEHTPEGRDGATPGRRVPVLADREKLVQVFINLLSNAVKFTPTGGQVRIALTPDDIAPEGADRVEVRVSDTGVGIPADKLDAIFEPFVQVRDTYSPGQGGTGLGLAIVRDLLRGMGGDVRAESAPGQGATFVITLRRAASGV